MAHTSSHIERLNPQKKRECARDISTWGRVSNPVTSPRGNGGEGEHEPRASLSLSEELEAVQLI